MSFIVTLKSITGHKNFAIIATKIQKDITGVTIDMPKHNCGTVLSMHEALVNNGYNPDEPDTFINGYRLTISHGLWLDNFVDINTTT